MTTHTKTLKLRIKDKHCALLNGLSRDVNMVWNYLNELSSRAIRERGQFMSGYDLQKYVAGATKEGLGIPSQTLQQICEEYATRRRQFKKAKLRWRVSNPKSPKRSLGWLPFKKGAVVWRNGQLRYAGKWLSLWDSYGLSQYELRGGSFSQDSRGRWYLNVVVKVEVKQSEGTKSVAIDLGLKDSATTSDGQVVHGRHYRALSKKLAIAQRAGKTDRVRAIHHKISNRRKDEWHKFSRKLVRENGAIFVGNVSSQKLVKTKMAKSTLDAGWSMFKTILEYKCHQAGVVFEEVNEAYTTQTCSECRTIPDASPKGIGNLDVRHWVCGECGAEHDRDVNAARNILARGIAQLVIESAAVEAKACEASVNKAQAEVGSDLPAEGILAL